MRALRAAAALSLVGLSGCINTWLAERHEREVSKVESVVRDFNVALTRGDTTALRTLLRSDFRMIEDSIEYDVQAAITAVSGVLQGGTVSREVTEMHVEEKGGFAWATYRVRGEYASGRDTLRFRRVEATVLERIARQWVIAFMTSAPAGSQ